MRICQDIVGRIIEHTCESVILVVTNPVDILTYAALKFSGLPRNKVIGSGTVLDSSRFRYFLSRHCGIDASNIHAYVLGEHGDSEVFAWGLTHIAGMQIDAACKICDRTCGDKYKEEIERGVRDSAYHIIDAKGATNYAVGLAMRRIVRAILRDEHSILTVSTLLDGEFGIRDVCLGAPAVVDAGGSSRVFDAPLDGEELDALRKSADSLKSVLRNVGLQ